MDDDVGMAGLESSSLGELPRSQLGIDAATMLRRHIVDGQLPPGTRLVEREVASLLRVSRTPVRDALSLLARERLVEASPRGFAVSELSQHEVEEIYPLIAALERVAVERVPGIKDAWLDRLERANGRFEAADGDPTLLIETDIVWHAELVNESQNRSLLEMLANLKTRAERYERAFFVSSEGHSQSVEEHRQIRLALVSGDMTRAARLVESHWLESMRPVWSAVQES